MISNHDKQTIRELAARWRDLAAQPLMNERKRLWKAVHDLAAERPMILIETSSIDGFVAPSELACEDPLLRAVERNLLDNLRHAEEVGDDVVLEPYFRIGWQMELSGFGVPVETKPAVAADGSALGYTFSFPIKRPEEIGRLRRRTVSANREKTRRIKATLEEVMGDLLPVRVGNDGLMRYMVEDRKRIYEYMESQGLLVPNTDSQMAGPRAYGHVSELPGQDHEGPLALKDLWGWAESQETTIVSPEMYEVFVLPYLAELSRLFGLVY